MAGGPLVTGFRLPALATALALGWPGLAPAQDSQTLADIRQELSVLFFDIQQLRGELNTSGAPGAAVLGNSALERLTAIEAELQRLTRQTEELEFRINRITTDGTNRIGDLEFRLCELEPGCDLSQLGDTPLLGGADSAENLPAPAQSQPETDGPSLAISEREDFERAREALAQGDFRSAADLFATFVQTYPGGPLNAQAHYLRGEALESLGDVAGAARAYLDAFSGAPEGRGAPEALFKLGTALGALGQTEEACVTLAEVGTRFPGSAAAGQAQTAMAGLACQ